MASRGYTLLEILVVVVILAVMSGFTVLALRGVSETDRLNEATARLAALLQVQCEEALLGTRALRVRVDRTGYRFEVLTHTGWQAHDEDVFRPRAWPLPLSLQLDVDGSRDAQAIVCLPTGELTPFELHLRSADGSVSSVRATAGGVVERYAGR